MTALADQVRSVVDEQAAPLTAQTVERWWADTFGEDVTYSGIFERVARTKVDREGLLRAQVELGVEPGPAHRAIAQLVQLGVVKVIVTLNFDHLFEDALREIGIEPRIISTEAAAAAARPVPGGDAVVVHLHGDYRDAASMLNTTAELRGYAPSLRQLVARIISDHGLLIAGWSADHDHALRELLVEHHRGYYRPVWVTPSQPSQVAQQLMTALEAVHYAATADDAFGRLADSVAALARRGSAARHPLSAALIVDRIKRDLAGDRPAITAHDTFAEEAARLDDLPALHPADFDPAATADYEGMLDSIDAACRTLIAGTAVLAYWGDEACDLWWQATLGQWARRSHGSGLARLLNLPLTVAVRLFYAAALAQVAARRFGRLMRTCRIEGTSADVSRPPQSVVRVLDWARIHRDLDRAVTARLRDELSETVRQALSLSAERMETVWQEFEAIRAAAQILVDDNRPPHPVDSVVSMYPHVRVEHDYAGGRRAWVSPAARRIATDADIKDALASLSEGQIGTTASHEAASQALQALDFYFHQEGTDAEQRLTRGHSGFTKIPMALWLDELSSE